MLQTLLFITNTRFVGCAVSAGSIGHPSAHTRRVLNAVLNKVGCCYEKVGLRLLLPKSTHVNCIVAKLASAIILGLKNDDIIEP